jgi:phosphoribosyl 1,2-cyclic phosphodiesterase
MSLSIASLNSGSNGNCYFIGSATDAVLVDAGLSCAQALRRIGQLGIERKQLRGIFISHEHTDHIRGLAALSVSLDLPVYINEGTLKATRTALPKSQVHIIAAGQSVRAGSLEVVPFSKNHDAADPLSFLVRHQDITAGVFTDIGHVCTEVSNRFSECHAAILESNYDPVMLRNGRYPEHLKSRIVGGKGHLSNRQALDLFRDCRAPHLSLLLLGHLSAENNCPGLVQELFAPFAGNTTVAVAGRYAATEMYPIVGRSTDGPSLLVPRVMAAPKQLSLFDFSAV